MYYTSPVTHYHVYFRFTLKNLLYLYCNTLSFLFQIYVYERGQAVKVILNQKPADGSKYGSNIVRSVNSVFVISYIFLIDYCWAQHICTNYILY